MERLCPPHCVDGRQDLDRRGPLHAVLLQHRTDEQIDPVRVDRERWDTVLDVEDGQRTVLLAAAPQRCRVVSKSDVCRLGGTGIHSQRCRIVAQLVEQDSERPDV